MMSSKLPPNPSLEHLKKQAKSLLAEGKAQRLVDAQLLIAREYGFPSWPKLKHHIETLSADPVAALVAALKGNDISAARRILAGNSTLRQRLNEPLPGIPFEGLAIHTALHHQNREMIDLLLMNGADINAKSRWWAGGYGVLDQADPVFVPFLRERGAMLSINSAARLGFVDEVARFLHNDPALVHARGGDGQTPLHEAATIEIARLLVEHGADINALDIDH
jgi:hypothetical protein